MDDSLIRSGWDIALFVVPMMVLLVMSFFRLDSAMAATRRRIGPPAPIRHLRPVRVLPVREVEKKLWPPAALAASPQAREAEENLSRLVSRYRTMRRSSMR